MSTDGVVRFQRTEVEAISSTLRTQAVTIDLIDTVVEDVDSLQVTLLLPNGRTRRITLRANAWAERFKTERIFDVEDLPPTWGGLRDDCR